MRKKVIIISIAIVFIGAIIGVVTRMSYQNVSEQLPSENLDNAFVSYLTDDSKWNLIPTNLTDLLQNSDLVVRVIATDESEVQELCMLTKVTILDVYQGDSGLVGDQVAVYEPASFEYIYEAYFITYDGYMLMQPDNEYILFLKSVAYPNDPFNKDFTDQTYYPCSCKFAKYSLSNTEKIDIIELDDIVYDSSELSFKDIKNYTFLSNNFEDKKLYESILGMIVTRWSINE